MAMMMAQRPLAIDSPWLRGLQAVIYSALIANGFYYFYLDMEAFSILPSGLGPFTLLQTFSTTFDYMGWLLLMWVLNIRTRWEIPKGARGAKGWVLNGLALTGYLVLGFATYLYVTDYFFYDEFVAYTSSQICAQADGEVYFLDALQQYQLLTSDNCDTLSGVSVLRHANEETLITPGNRKLGYWLAGVNVVNAVTWLLLLVVLPLKLSIRRNWPSRAGLLRVLDGLKYILYLILLVNAINWLIYGTWVDALDGFLWLIAVVSLDWLSRRPNAQGFERGRAESG